MNETPVIPQITGAGLPDLGGVIASFPIRLEASPLVLLVLALLVGILVAAMSVILVYHWRRFPFEQATFRAAERVYLGGTAVLFLVAMAGILLS